jgi:hypothetical protein
MLTPQKDEAVAEAKRIVDSLLSRLNDWDS